MFNGCEKLKEIKINKEYFKINKAYNTYGFLTGCKLLQNFNIDMFKA